MTTSGNESTWLIDARVPLREISEKNLERASIWHPGGLIDWTVSEWAIAMAGEAGEVCDAIKKYNRLLHKIESSNNPASYNDAVEKIGEEIADTVLYLDLLAQRLGLDLTTLVIRKFNKISVREALPVFLPYDGSFHEPEEQPDGTTERAG